MRGTFSTFDLSHSQLQSHFPTLKHRNIIQIYFHLETRKRNMKKKLILMNDRKIVHYGGVITC